MVSAVHKFRRNSRQLARKAMENRSRMVFEALPPRPRGLSQAEYSSVVGGCISLGEKCTKSAECCSSLVCADFSPYSNDRYCRVNYLS